MDRLATVHPELRKRVLATIADLATAGRDVRVVQGLRTYAEQDMLYAQGRTRKGPKVTNARGGQSNHNFGCAVDLCPFKAGKPDWNDDAAFNAIGVAGKANGLLWGGDWKFVDKPHLELPTGLKTQTCRELYAKGGLDAVWAKASQLLNVSVPSQRTSEATSKPTGLTTTATKTADNQPVASPILQRGDHGPAVEKVQKELGVRPDGLFGKKTYDAVIAYQRKHNLYVDGRVGKETAAKLGI